MILLLLLLVAAIPVAAADFVVRDSVLIIPAGTTKIPMYCFQYRNDFKRVEFAEPCRLHVIDQNAFAWCENLEEVVLPESVVDIKRLAFAYCFSLRSVKMGKRITHIGSNVFSFCKSLEQIEFPSSITELESYVCSECVSLKHAVLPGNGHLLGELMFSGCRELESITINSIVPPKFDCNSTLFENTESFMYDRCVLYVPTRSVESYSEASGWNLFKTISPISRYSLTIP